MLLPAAAAPLQQGERDRAMSELHATRKQFLDAIAGLTPEQWKFKPAEGAWSIAECAEHITLAEDSLFEMVTKQIMASPADPARREAAKVTDETVLTGVADRSRKATAPESLRPAGKWATARELADHFRTSRDRTIAYVRTTDAELRDHFMSQPALGDMDAYQWILMIAAHSGRHVQQINEVKSNPNFPRP